MVQKRCVIGSKNSRTAALDLSDQRVFTKILLQKSTHLFPIPAFGMVEITIERQVAIEKSVLQVQCFGAADRHVEDRQIDIGDGLPMSAHKIKGQQRL